jgi:hypothetical protein
MFDRIGREDPPPITHPAFFYGFVGTALLWQIGFILIARDPIRLRPVMVLAVLEKCAYSIPAITLYTQHRLHSSDLVFPFVDILLGILFVIAFFKTADSPGPA